MQTRPGQALSNGVSSATHSASHTAGAAPNDELHGHWRTVGPGTQHGAREAWSGLGDELRDTFKAAFKVGAEAWRESRRAAAANGAEASAANGSAAAAAAGMARFARRGHGKAKEWSTRWLNDSNRVVMSSVVVPEGEQYTCTDNEISVSALSRLLFKVAEFNGHRLRAASISGLMLEEGIFRAQQVSGSSLHRLEVRRGMLRDNQFNGSSVARLTLQAGQFAHSVCNGAHLRDVEIVDSALSGLRITGGDLRDIAVLAGSRIDQLQITAATVHGLRCEASVLEHLTLRFVEVRGFVVRDSRLTNVRLHNGERTRLGSGAVRGLQVLNSKLTDVEFVDCNFDGACIRDCDVHGLTFAGVDFGSRDIVGNRMLEGFVTASARRHG